MAFFQLLFYSKLSVYTRLASFVMLSDPQTQTALNAQKQTLIHPLHPPTTIRIPRVWSWYPSWFTLSWETLVFSTTVDQNGFSVSVGALTWALRRFLSLPVVCQWAASHLTNTFLHSSKFHPFKALSLLIRCLCSLQEWWRLPVWAPVRTLISLRSDGDFTYRCKASQAGRGKNTSDFHVIVQITQIQGTGRERSTLLELCLT